MKTSQTGLNLIKRFEGLRLKAYKCPAGIWTIGFGHTAGVKPNDVITREKANELLKQDLAPAERIVNKYAQTHPLTQHQFDALVSFTFNCGSGSFATLTSKGRNLNQVAEAMLLYVRGANGVVLEGLKNRRKAEYQLFKN